MAIDLLVTDENLAVVGDPLDGWTNLDVTRRFNEPASGTLTVPARPEVMAQLQPGNRLTVVRDGAIWCAGPMEITQDYSWGVGSDGEPGVGTVSVSFSDDLALLAGHVTYTDPGNVWTAASTLDHWTRTNLNAEAIIRELVDVNCGPSALADRQIPGLVLGALAGVGTTTTLTTRWEPLLDACRRAALNGGELGFRTRVVGTQIVFEVYAPQDLTATARFSEGLGNLRSVQYKRSAPTATRVLLLGTEPEAGARAKIQLTNTAETDAWWMVEKFVEGSVETNDDGELIADANEALSEGAAVVELATATVDTDDLKAGRDYGLGDRVTVELPTGVEVADVVRSIHLQATPDAGEHVTTLVGSPEATSDDRMVRIVRELGRRLGRIEAR